MMALLAALLSLVLAAPVPPRAQGQDPRVPPIQEEGDFFVLNFSENLREALNLEDFVNLCQEATGLNFTYNDQTATALQQSTVVMLGPKRIPKKDFYAFFQIQMFINEFVCIEVGPPHISVILIQSTGGQRAGGLRQKAVYVNPADLDNYLDQPATLITTVLNLPNTDVRTLSTSMRTMLTDTNTQAMIPAGERALILQGFGTSIASLASLLYLVDEQSAETDRVQPVFDVIPLEYAAAEEVADLIEQLLEARQRSAASRARPVPQENQGISGALTSGDVEAKILTYARNNSLLIMAAPEDMPRIKDLVARLDVDVTEPERNFHVYSLQNVKARDIAEVLDEFLSDAERVARQAQGGTGGAAAPATPRPSGTGGADNEVIVVPDEASNSLLVAANKTRYEEVVELLRQLDRRQDQVLIETALIELTGTDFRDIGVELAFADVDGDGGFGATSFGLSTLTDSDGDGVPDLRIPNVGDGLTAGILSADDVNLPFLIAAIQRKEGANVLNVPSVLVNNNGSARVETKDEQPTTTITATGGVGGQTQENFRAFEEAGITLEISPSISASRYLRLDISLVVSTFTGSFSNQSSIPPPRITREIRTTVNVPDGDTMVIGGIITDNITETRRQTPWLGDIPILGWLFSRTAKTNTTTTLYFFVTPHILLDRDFADLAEISYQKKLQAAEVIGRDRVRVVDPNFGKSDGEVDLQGFQVPLYKSPERGEVDPDAVGITPERRRELMKDTMPEGESPQENLEETRPTEDEGDDEN